MKNIEALRILFLDYLKGQLSTLPDQPLYDPVRYIMQIGGKRLRPVMLLMSAQLFDQSLQKALPAALAIEVFHNFTLLHDDIMDEAPLRRGKPTVHVKYDVNTAILSGDAMSVLAYQYLGQVQHNVLPMALSEFSAVALGICEGQQMDMAFETMTDVKEEEYLKMIELKTAVLLSGAMKIGATIGGANTEQANHIAAFAKNTGIAFQLQDDILDTFGDPEKFGKKVGGDIAQNKKTYLVIKTLELAGEADKALLNSLMQTRNVDSEAEKIATVKALFNKLHIREIAETKMQEYLDLAFSHLEKAGLTDDQKTPLKAFARQLVSRDH